MDYSLSPDTDTDNRFSLMFRAENASEAPPEIRDRILRYFELYLDLLDSVDRKVVFNPPTYSVRINQQNLTAAAKREIENIAAKCRQVFALEGASGGDLFIGLEDAGVNVLSFPTDPIITIRNYGYITEEQKNEFFKCLYTKGYMRSEPEPLSYFAKNRRRDHLVKRFYLDEQISLSKAAEYLGISLIEARELVKKWGVES